MNDHIKTILLMEWNEHEVINSKLTHSLTVSQLAVSAVSHAARRASTYAPWGSPSPSNRDLLETIDSGPSYSHAHIHTHKVNNSGSTRTSLPTPLNYICFCMCCYICFWAALFYPMVPRSASASRTVYSVRVYIERRCIYSGVWLKKKQRGPACREASSCLCLFPSFSSVFRSATAVSNKQATLRWPRADGKWKTCAFVAFLTCISKCNWNIFPWRLRWDRIHFIYYPIDGKSLH